MKWDIHWLQWSAHGKTQSGVTINASTPQNRKINSLRSALPPSFSPCSSTNSMIASPWIRVSTVYTNPYSIPGSPVSSGSDPFSSPCEWKEHCTFIQWCELVEIEESEKLAVSEDWTQGLWPELQMLWALSCNHQLLVSFISICR